MSHETIILLNYRTKVLVYHYVQAFLPTMEVPAVLNLSPLIFLAGDLLQYCEVELSVMVMLTVFLISGLSNNTAFCESVSP